jgi:hypothetical protein
MNWWNGRYASRVAVSIGRRLYRVALLVRLVAGLAGFQVACCARCNASILNEAADQPALAAQASRLGAGIHLHDEGATATAIAFAIRTVLDNSTYAVNARALGDRIHTYGNRPRAVVERILRHASSGQLTATGGSPSSQSTGLQIDWSQ